MKKMILILILVIPVMIAMVITLIAGFVIRELTFPEVQSVYIPSYKKQTMYKAFGRDNMGLFTAEHDTYLILEIPVGKRIDLNKFVRIAPQKARFQDITSIFYSWYSIDGEGDYDGASESPIEINKNGILIVKQECRYGTRIDIKNDSGVYQLTFLFDLAVNI